MMSDTASRLRVKRDGDLIEVEFIDRNILDEANIQQIGDEISALIDSASKPRLLIGFQNVDHLSSAALGTLITIRNRVRAKGGELRLAEIDPQIYEVFVITKLANIFRIHDTMAEARSSMASVS
jgi:anti-anti-sigma factor